MNDEKTELTGLVEENARLKKRIEQLQERRYGMYNALLLWRGINRENGDTPCKKCLGAGVCAYGDTSTWHGGAGGQMVTSDICDKCWGSGKENKPWLNLRKLPMQST